MASGSKLNVFGWASTSPCYGGTGSGGVSGVNTDLLAALTAYGVAYNTELTDMYKDFQDGREHTLPERLALSSPAAGTSLTSTTRPTIHSRCWTTPRASLIRLLS